MTYIFSIYDLFPYVFLISVLLIFLNIRKGGVIISLTLFAFMILRFNVGWDYQEYLKIISESNDEVFRERYGLINNTIFWIGNKIGAFWVFTFYSAITIYFFNYTLKKYSISPTLSWMIYVMTPLFFLQSLSTIRYSAALSISFLGITMILNDKKIKGIFYLILASFFHISALAGFLVFLMQKKLFKVRELIFIILSSFLITSFSLVKRLIMIIANAIFSENSRLIKWYLSYDGNKSSEFLPLIILVITFIILFIYLKRETSKIELKYLNILTYGALLYKIFNEIEPVIAIRLSSLFLIVLTLIIASLNTVFKKNSRILSTTLVTIIFLLIFSMYLRNYILAYNQGILSKIGFIPYYTWLSNN